MGDINRYIAGGDIAGVFSGRKGVAITGSAQTFDPTGRAILVETAGTVTGKLIDDSFDVAYTLPVGLWPLQFKSITSVSSLAGKIIL